MRLSVAALLVASVALIGGLLIQPPERVAADFNLNGDWTMYVGNIPACPTTIVQTDSGDYIQPLLITPSPSCFPYGEYLGTIDVRNGYISANATRCQLAGFVSDNGHTVSGDVACFGSVSSGGPFVLTGGAGDPKFPTPTFTPCPGPCPTATPTATSSATVTPTLTPAPPPVGGIALDKPASSGNDAFAVWWLSAFAGTAFVTLSGALYGRRRVAR